MGCDIHLHLERRNKRNDASDNEKKWRHCNITGYMDEWWGERIYEMFALLNNVRNDWYEDDEILENRGFPDDTCDFIKKRYYNQVVAPEDLTDEQIEEHNDDSWNIVYDGIYKEKQTIDDWVKHIGIKSTEIDGVNRYVCPDWHSPNWCTTQEMEKCLEKLFRDENGKLHDCYHEWYALLGAMKGYEADGETECRAVFWFDN